jgi:hypothetical protein
MAWAKEKRRPAGGYWACRIKRQLHRKRWKETHPEQHHAAKRRGSVVYRKKHPDKITAMNARRLVVGGMYLGMIGMTETELRGIQNGSSE